MKSFVKFLLLLVIVAIVALVGWRLLSDSLFDDDPVSTETKHEQAAQVIPQPQANATGVPKEQAFESTDSKAATTDDSNHFDCADATAYIGQLYDLYKKGKNKDQLEAFINNADAIPEDQVNSFLNFIKTLTAVPLEKLPTREKFVENFQKQCLSSK